MRDLVLASQYKDSLITFATQDLKGNINHRILESDYNLEILNSNNKKELVKLIQKLDINLLIIDHYQITYKEEKYIKDKTDVKILCFDDTYEKHHCDIVLNHNISADKLKYKNLVPKSCKLKCGSRFTLLREEFYQQKNKIKKQNSSKIKNIFLSMGGSDPTNLNLKILKILSKFENIKINLITTSANQNIKKLQKYIKNKAWVKLHIDSTQIAKLMRKNDFAIIPPSVTANEIYFMEIPFIAIKTASNQEDIYQFLKKKKYDVLQKFDKKRLQQLIKKRINLASLKLRKVKADDRDFLYKLVNDKDVRKNSIHSDIITYKNHKKWFQSKIKQIKNKNCKIYILMLNKKRVAQIRLDKEDDVWIIDLSLDEKFRGYGFAHKMLKLLQNKLQDETLVAYVKNTNIASKRLFENFSFVKTKESKGLSFYRYKIGEG